MKKFKDIPYNRPDLEQFKVRGEIILRDLTGADSAAQAIDALTAFDALGGELETGATIAYIRNTIDMTNSFYDQEINYLNEALPALIPLQLKLSNALLNSPFREALTEQFGRQIFINAEIDIKTKDEAIMPEKIQEANLSQAYQKLIASCTTEFDGETVNFYGLLKHLEDPGSDRRRRAGQAFADLYAKVADELDDLFDQLIAVRQRMAAKLGFKNYIELAYLNLNRTTYSQTDVARFRRQIIDVIVPAASAIRKQQADRLGLTKMTFFDEALWYSSGNPNPQGTESEMIENAARMYRELSPETGEFFNFLAENELFDLATRPGKHMGGYCTSLEDYQAPFIFANFNGTSADVDVLTHEAGHAFAYYLASRRQKISEYNHSTNEINEIHSMAMELFTYPWMDYFFKGNADRYRLAHLSEALTFLPYIAAVDEFQHRIYQENLTGPERRQLWRELELIYLPWRDYDGVTFLEEGGFWLQKQHIFLYPFYYIDYALAQMGAFELYGRMKEDRKKAWTDYLNLCRAGGSDGYLELLELAGINNPFAAGSVQKAAGHVIEEVLSGF